MRHGHQILSAFIITCLLTLTLTGCDDATAPETADTLPEPAAKSYDPDAAAFFDEHGDAALNEAQQEFEQEFPDAKVYGLTFAVDDGTDMLLSGWCGSDGDPPFWPEEFRNHMEGWIQQEGGPEGYTVKALAALPPNTDFAEAGELQVQEIDPTQLPYVRASASGEVEPLQNQPLPDPFSKLSITPLTDPFINVFLPLQVDGGVVPMAKSMTDEVTMRMGQLSPEYVALFGEITANDPVYIGELELEVEVPTVPFYPNDCYWTDPPPDWCWNWDDVCYLYPPFCEFRLEDYWKPEIELPDDYFHAVPKDLYTLDPGILSDAQIDVIENGDRILRPTGTVVESVLMTPDFEGAGVERPY